MTHRLAITALALTLIAGCAGDNPDPTAGTGLLGGPGAEMGEPTFTPDLYFRAGQLADVQAIETDPAEPAKIRRLEAAAMRSYAKALDLDKDHAPTLYAVAALRSRRGDWDEAAEAWQRYADATGRGAAAMTNLAVAQERGGKLPEAESSYKSALLADPKFKVARVNLGVLLARRGDVMPARRQLAAVLEPAAVEWHVAAALQSVGQTERAEDHYRAAAALDPAYSERPDLTGASVRVDE